MIGSQFINLSLQHYHPMTCQMSTPFRKITHLTFAVLIKGELRI